MNLIKLARDAGFHVGDQFVAGASEADLQRFAKAVLKSKAAWIELTDGDIREVSKTVAADGPKDCVDRFAYAIEAKLKEKNT